MPGIIPKRYDTCPYYICASKKESMMERILTVISLAVFLSACATPYQETGFGGGYSETKLSSTMFNVRFQGNGFTSPERVSDLALLRCAEVCLEHGFGFFAITEKQFFDSAGMVMPMSDQGDSMTTRKSRTMNKIFCFPRKPIDISKVYRAENISQSIRLKYDIKEEN
jgi:hypothetical protein